ncbi:MAG: hypothetical protein ACRD26_00925 [Vicinamibacterales bacterium]
MRRTHERDDAGRRPRVGGRRAFLKSTAGLSTAAIGLRPGVACARGSHPGGGESHATQAAGGSPAARSLLEVVRARHGRHLAGTDDAELLQRIETNVTGDERLATYRLTNADAPGFSFRAD